MSADPRLSNPEPFPRSPRKASMPRCGDCRHWVPDADRDPNGECSVLGPDADRMIGSWVDAVVPVPFGFTCPPDFGCTLHEPAGRPTTSEDPQ